jgi:rod shape-determining protein MreD
MKNKNYLVITIFLFILVLFQTSFFSEIFGRFLNPNLVIALVFAYLVMDKAQEAFFSAFVGGLLLDISGNTIVGLSSLILVSIIIFTLLAKKLVQKGGILLTVILLIAFPVYTMIINYPNYIISLGLLIGALSTLLTGYIFYLIIRSVGNEHKYI